METSMKPKMAYVETVDSPAGPLTFAVDGADAMLWLKLCEGSYERTVEEELVREDYLVARDERRTAQARDQIQEYYAGTRRTFDLPLFGKARNGRTPYGKR